MEAPKAEEVKGQYIPEGVGDFSLVSVSLSNKTIKHPFDQDMQLEVLNSIVICNQYAITHSTKRSVTSWEVYGKYGGRYISSGFV